MLLALETSTHMLSVALATDRGIIERSAYCASGGSDRLLPWVQEVLDEAGIALADIDAVAFGAGPGSFTGLRLACAAAQGLAYGAGLPVIAIGTLEALAQASGTGRIYACLDARMNEVYSAAFEVSADSMIQVMDASVAAPNAVPLPPGRGWKGCGDGFATYGEALATRLGSALSTTDPQVPPLACAVAQLAARRWRAGATLSPADAAPIYVRDKVALTTAERLARGGTK